MVASTVSRGGLVELDPSERLGLFQPSRETADQSSPARIAVLVPCFNEELTVASVVRGFRAALPSAQIYVYDNNSTDGTIAQAREAGATVRLERRQGKGHVVRRMFADVEADVYVLVDGDDTYDAAAAPAVYVVGAGRLPERRCFGRGAVRTKCSAVRPLIYQAASK